MVIIIALLTHYLETTRTRKCKNLVLLSQFADIAHFCIKRNIWNVLRIYMAKGLAAVVCTGDLEADK